VAIAQKQRFFFSKATKFYKTIALEANNGAHFLANVLFHSFMQNNLKY